MSSYCSGRSAVVFGGSEGIGLAVALRLVREGAEVTIVSRSTEKLAAALKALERVKSQPRQQIRSASLDVTKYDEVKKFTDSFVEQNGCPYFVINSAGQAIPGYMIDQDMDAYRKMMDLNYFGIVHTSKCFAPHLLKKGTGHIVNVSSMAGFLGLFGYTGYCASKYAVIGFSDALRNELKPFGINVSVLCPPNTRTPGLETENLIKPKEVLQTEEKAKVVDPEFIADALMKSLPSNKFMIVPTFDGTLAYYLARYSPFILQQFIKRPALNNQPANRPTH